jgi:SAM-dependent methyltransferase
MARAAEGGRGLATMASSVECMDNYVRWILDLFKPYFGKEILEIGTGHDNFRRHLPSADRFVSVDVDAQVVSRARGLNPGGIYVEADVEADDFAARIGPNKFDTVLCVNVLEHLFVPEKGIRNMLGALVQGGHLLLFTPAFQALFTDLDRLAGHTQRYTKRTLRAMIPADEGTVARMEYFNPVGGVGWFANRFVRHRDIDAVNVNAQVVVFDRYLIPLSRAINPVTRGFFGQSILCSVRKT